MNAFQFRENVLNCLEAEKIQGANDFRYFGEKYSNNIFAQSKRRNTKEE